jgi:hypothetical protein
MNGVASLKSHRLPETAFTALAAGRGDPAVIHLLQGAQQSKHTMLLHAIAEAVGDGDPADPGAAAFRVGYELLTRRPLRSARGSRSSWTPRFATATSCCPAWAAWPPATRTPGSGCVSTASTWPPATAWRCPGSAWGRTTGRASRSRTGAGRLRSACSQTA